DRQGARRDPEDAARRRRAHAREEPLRDGLRHAPRERPRARLDPQHVPGGAEGPGLCPEGPPALPLRDEGRNPRRRGEGAPAERPRRPARGPEEEGGEEVMRRSLLALAPLAIACVVACNAGAPPVARPLVPNPAPPPSS